MTNSPAKLCAKFVGYDVREPLSRLLFSASCLLSLVPCLPYCKCFRFNVIDNNLMAKSLGSLYKMDQFLFTPCWILI